MPKDTHTPSRFFRIIKMLFVAALVVAAAWGFKQLKDPEQFPINTIKVQASYAHTSQVELSDAMTPFVNQGFFNLNKKALTQAIMTTSPWIAEVNLHRIWPDGLQIEIIEQVPVAQWEGKALINEDGNIFYAEPSTFLEELPIFATNEGQVAEVLSLYKKMQVILSPTGMTISEISATDRQAITLTLKNDTNIIIGRKDPLPRLQRFVKVYPKVFKADNHAETIDLRYQHGLSVKWQ